MVERVTDYKHVIHAQAHHENRNCLRRLIRIVTDHIAYGVASHHRKEDAYDATDRDTNAAKYWTTGSKQENAVEKDLETCVDYKSCIMKNGTFIIDFLLLVKLHKDIDMLIFFIKPPKQVDHLLMPRK